MVEITQVIRTHRKTIALIVQRDGRLVVRAPIRASDDAIRRLVESKEDWIRAKQQQVKATYLSIEPKKFVNGEGFWYQGQIYELEIVDHRSPALSLDGSFRLSRHALYKARRVFERWYRQQAALVLPERVQWQASRHGFTYNQVKITSARTRWGSCNSKGTLCFAWRLIMAPLPVIDYVVAHELVHLQVKNHCKEFWSRVRLIMPDYKQRIDWLSQNGHLLSLD
jgi:predicted metal-dependent hydrolase